MVGHSYLVWHWRCLIFTDPKYPKNQRVWLTCSEPLIWDGRRWMSLWTGEYFMIYQSFINHDHDESNRTRTTEPPRLSSFLLNVFVTPFDFLQVRQQSGLLRTVSQHGFSERKSLLHLQWGKLTFLSRVFIITGKNETQKWQKILTDEIFSISNLAQYLGWALVEK